VNFVEKTLSIIMFNFRQKLILVFVNDVLRPRIESMYSIDDFAKDLLYSKAVLALPINFGSYF